MSRFRWHSIETLAHVRCNKSQCSPPCPVRLRGPATTITPSITSRFCCSDLDRAPAALLAAPPTKLLISLEQMQRAFWEKTAHGQGILHQLEHAPFEPTLQSRRALQTAPYGNRWAGGCCGQPRISTHLHTAPTS